MSTREFWEKWNEMQTKRIRRRVLVDIQARIRNCASNKDILGSYRMEEQQEDHNNQYVKVLERFQAS